MAVDNNDTTLKAPVVEQAPEVAEPKRGSFFSRLFGGIGHFLREVQVELKKTNWPSKDELTKFTIVVLTTLVVVGVYLFVADFVLGHIADRVFHVQTLTR